MLETRLSLKKTSSVGAVGARCISEIYAFGVEGAGSSDFKQPLNTDTIATIPVRRHVKLVFISSQIFVEYYSWFNKQILNKYDFLPEERCGTPALMSSGG